MSSCYATRRIVEACTSTGWNGEAADDANPALTTVSRSASQMKAGRGTPAPYDIPISSAVLHHRFYMPED
jgi:hypothetical protein